MKDSELTDDWKYGMMIDTEVDIGLPKCIPFRMRRVKRDGKDTIKTQDQEIKILLVQRRAIYEKCKQ